MGRTVAAITFAIPFFRDAAFLAAAVASVRAQTIDDWELVVIDDAGPDGDAGAAVVAALADSRARYVRHERNLGLAGNWNRSKSCGEHQVTARVSSVTMRSGDSALNRKIRS